MKFASKCQVCVCNKRHLTSSELDNCPFLPMAHEPLVDQGILIIEASGLHSDTPRSVGLLWTNDQPDAETFM